MNLTFPQIRSGNLRERVATSIRNAIVSGNLQPGQPLVQSEIANQMGVSKGPVREALSRLEQEGLAYSITNKGTFVANPTAEDVEELFSLRCVLETSFVNRSIENIKDEDVSNLEEIITNRNKAIEKDEIIDAVKLDMDFHGQLITLAEHKLLLRTWSTIAIRIKWLLVLLNKMVDANGESMYQPYRSHDQIMASIRERNVRGTEEALEAHIQASGDLIVENWRYKDKRID